MCVIQASLLLQLTTRLYSKTIPIEKSYKKLSAEAVNFETPSSVELWQEVACLIFRIKHPAICVKRITQAPFLSEQPRRDEV